MVMKLENRCSIEDIVRNRPMCTDCRKMATEQYIWQTIYLAASDL